MDGIVKGIDSDADNGIKGGNNLSREAFYGSNFRPPLVAETCCSMFLAALDDFMLKLLIVCAIVSITLDTAMADAEERKHGK